MDVFLSTKHHVSAEELLSLVVKEQSERKGSTGSIGIATIYRTLKLFVEAEIATERHFEDDITRYEVLIEGEHHDHLICLDCNHIFEFEDDIMHYVKFKSRGKKPTVSAALRRSGAEVRRSGLGFRPTFF